MLGLVIVPTTAVEAPDLSQVSLKSVFYQGTGCGAGSVSGFMPQGKESFTLVFDLYRVEVSPTASITSARKNCLILVDLTYPAGIRYSIPNTTFAGDAALDTGVTLSQQVGYYYIGREEESSTNMTLEGPKSSHFEFTDQHPRSAWDTVWWSPCGQPQSLNINSRVSLKKTIANATGVFPADLPGGLLGQFSWITGLVWRRCAVLDANGGQQKGVERSSTSNCFSST
ncbi:hypothetical protein DL95DRAFT_376280 [Leptodontidium sp. 2 PMI_412]|nr:hypothetical protein DL95DRAFT_376280 [Leptodontidium sp. 2 PMI_412]